MSTLYWGDPPRRTGTTTVERYPFGDKPATGGPPNAAPPGKGAPAGAAPATAPAAGGSDLLFVGLLVGVAWWAMKNEGKRGARSRRRRK